MQPWQVGRTFIVANFYREMAQLNSSIFVDPKGYPWSQTFGKFLTQVRFEGDAGCSTVFCSGRGSKLIDTVGLHKYME